MSTVSSSPEQVRYNLPERIFCDEQQHKVSSEYHPALTEIEESFTNLQVLHEEIVSSLAIEKPVWFEQAETRARTFMEDMGFATSDVNIFMLKNGELSTETSLLDSPTTLAESLAIERAIYVHNERVSEPNILHLTDGILVHELAHVVSANSSVFGASLDSSRPHGVRISYREGFHIVDDPHRSAMFYEEGFAVFMAGFYRRRMADPAAQLAAVIEPNNELPWYIDQFNPEQVSGPEGYAMELIAYGLEKNNILSANDFLKNFIATRHSDTLTDAFRQHAQAIDQLSRGLYVYLRNLEYSRENWQAGLRKVLSVVLNASDKVVE